MSQYLHKLVTQTHKNAPKTVHELLNKKFYIDEMAAEMDSLPTRVTSKNRRGKQ